MANELVILNTLKTDFKEIAISYLKGLGIEDELSIKKYQNTLGDFAYYVTPENVDLLMKMRNSNFLNAMYRVSKTGALFSQKEASLLPFEIKKKEKRGDIVVEILTGEYDAVLVIDINYQKQMIQSLPNCKRFFTCEVYDGVQPILNLSTGNYEFDGINNALKPTIGYYAVFLDTEDIIHDIFMSNAEIIKRAESNPKVKKDNYKDPKNNIHMEKIVIRNLMKEIPKVTESLKVIESLENGYDLEITEHEDVTDKKPNALEDAKKELAGKTTKTRVSGETVPMVTEEPNSSTEEQKEPQPIPDFFGANKPF